MIRLEEIVDRLVGALEPGSVFGFTPEEYDQVLPVVDKERRLPDGFAPGDLVAPAGAGIPTRRDQPVRAIVLPDLTALFRAARAAGHELWLVSAYRSYEYQIEVFDRFVEEELAAGAPTREEARRRANRYSALPGHSEHQLGTTVDVSVPEIDFELSAALGELPAGRWLAREAWRFGFALSYPAPDAEPRTGYVYEPWHLRWVGRSLAAWLREDGYLRDGAWAEDQPVLREYLLALEDAVLRRSPLTDPGRSGA